MLNIPFRCEKSIVINKHISLVAPVVGNFHTWDAWSPWLCMEKDCAPKIHGSIGEPGHRQEWDGTRIGSGSMKMTAATETSFDYDLQFLKPWKSSSKVKFTFDGTGGETKITWAMRSGLPVFLGFMIKTTKAMVESDFDRGLKMLKEYLETGTVVSDTEVTGMKEKDGFYYVGLRKASSIEDMPAAMSKDFGKLMEMIKEGDLQEPLDCVAFYHKYDLIKQRCEFTSALVYEQPPENTHGLISSMVPDHRVVQSVHTGSYLHLGNAWSATMAEQRSNKSKMNKKIPWYERYVNNPEEVDADELITEINIPIK